MFDYASTFTCPRDVYIVHYPTAIVLWALRALVVIYVVVSFQYNHEGMLRVDPMITFHARRDAPDYVSNGDPARSLLQHIY